MIMTKRSRKSLELFPNLKKSWQLPSMSSTIGRRWTFGFIGNLKTHEMKMKVREEMRVREEMKAIAFKVTPSLLMKMNHWKTMMRTLLCSLEKWVRCSTRREDKATSEEEDLEEDLKRRRRRILTFIARKQAILLRIAPHFKLLPPRTCIKKRRQW